MIELIGEVAAKTVEVGAEVAEKAAEVAEKAAEVAEETIETTKEITETTISELGNTNPLVLEPNLNTIKETSLSSLIAANERISSPVVESGIGNLLNEAKSTIAEETAQSQTAEGILSEKIGLTEEQKAQIIQETGWPKEIVDCIETMEQYEIYENAGLKYAEIDGRPCLIKDIEPDYVDEETGLTNRELMEKGRAPIDSKTGEKIELHHMGQDFDSPFAELCSESEHGDGNDKILHDKLKESWRRDATLKNNYQNVQRPNHWKARAKEAKA